MLLACSMLLLYACTCSPDFGVHPALALVLSQCPLGSGSVQAAACRKSWSILIGFKHANALYIAGIQTKPYALAQSIADLLCTKKIELVLDCALRAPFGECVLDMDYHGVYGYQALSVWLKWLHNYTVRRLRSLYRKCETY
jgi:hypothetical protein